MKTARPSATHETRAIIKRTLEAHAAGLSIDQIIASVAKETGVFPSRVRKVIDQFEVLA